MPELRVCFKRYLPFLLPAFLIGCNLQITNIAEPHSSLSQGTVHGGQQPVSGASVQLYAVGTTGDGSIATPLLSPAATTDGNGDFKFGPYQCPNPSALVYAVATGGNPGLAAGVVNSGLALMASIGSCGSITVSTFIQLNELTTVAAVDSLASFMTSSSAVGSSQTDAASLTSAFALSAELVDTTTGTAPGAVTVGLSIPSTQIYTLADIIASCVNSVGGKAGDLTPCGNLYALTPNALSVPPTDTVTALLNLAKNPTQNTAALFALVSPNSPYQPAASTLPPDLAVRPQYATGASVAPGSLTYKNVTVGFAQSSQTATIQNNQTTPVAITGWGFTGAGSSDYIVTDTTCAATLAAGNTCYYKVTFVPSVTGSRAAYLYVSNSSANPVLYVPLTGSGSAPSPTALGHLAGGYVAFGDSNTSGAGYTPSYPALLDSYFPSGSQFANYGYPGFECWNQAQSMFTALHPQDTGNPIVTDMIGFNDGYQILPTPGSPQVIYYNQCQMGANAYAALSSSNTVAAGSSAPTLSGAWTADVTYPNFPGIVSTTGNSCVSVTRNVPDGVFYLWHLKEYSSGGSIAVTVDGATATDTISGTSALTSIIPIYINMVNEAFPALARYVVNPGNHVVSACVTSATGPANDVHIYGFGFPPATPNVAATAPRVFLAGVNHFQDDPTDTLHPSLAYLDTLNKQVAQSLATDNLNVTFVDIRAFVDPHLGMLGVVDGSCIASYNPGAHVDNCGTFSLEQAFWEAINGAFAPN